MSEDRDTLLITQADDCRPRLGDLFRVWNFDLAMSNDAVPPRLAPAGDDVQGAHSDHHAHQRDKIKRAPLALKRTKSDMQYEHRPRHIHQHVQALPDPWRELVEPEIVARRRHDKEDGQRQQTQEFEWEGGDRSILHRSEEHTSELQSLRHLV